MWSLKSSIILSIKLAFEASAIIEKIIWISFAILGSSYFGHLLISQIVSWDEHSVMVFKGYESNSNIDYPAVTFCTRTNSKYAVMERIGNFLDLDSDFMKKYILPLRNDMIENDVNHQRYSAEYDYKDDCFGVERYRLQDFEDHCKV